MIVRLGYVALSKTLDITSSHSLNYSTFLKSNNDYQKLTNIINLNLESLNQIIDYNIKNNIHFYRISSNLIPLATLKEINFNYTDNYRRLYQQIGTKIKNHNMRVDMHPDQFTVLNSTKKEVLENALEILKYHYNVLEALDVKEKILILHIGSNVFGKKASMIRFINNFNKLPEYLKKCIVVENDDKIFNIVDTLNICKKIDRPMVLDYHHYICNKDNIDINNYYTEIFSTWKITKPKIHFSSPKNNTKKDIRSHHEYINVDSFILFIEEIKHLNLDLDIMIEAKAKDEALFRLIRQLKYKTKYKFIDDTTFEV
ncbi:MAG: UV DNA damage repair endonuclease UvsE [Firmicutes bacterium]|nr:UV DNA damage repair endonuclease UvsE [Bacillota bacterium]